METGRRRGSPYQECRVAHPAMHPTRMATTVLTIHATHHYPTLLSIRARIRWMRGRSTLVWERDLPWATTVLLSLFSRPTVDTLVLLTRPTGPHTVDSVLIHCLLTILSLSLTIHSLPTHVCVGATPLPGRDPCISNPSCVWLCYGMCVST